MTGGSTRGAVPATTGEMPPELAGLAAAALALLVARLAARRRVPGLPAQGDEAVRFHAAFAHAPAAMAVCGLPDRAGLLAHLAAALHPGAPTRVAVLVVALSSGS